MSESPASFSSSSNFSVLDQHENNNNNNNNNAMTIMSTTRKLSRMATRTNHATTTTTTITTPVVAPQWMYHFMAFRQRLFLQTVEPVIVTLLGPVVVEETEKMRPQPYAQNDFQHSHHHHHHHHRRLNFLPKYISNVEAFHETSMSFATLMMLFVTFSAVFLVFLSCFYHNQKTSPLFVSPRRHRLPKLVPPPLPVDGYFSWVKFCFYLSDEEIIHRIGYDSLIFLRFHRLALRCIVKMSVFSFVVLLPLNFTGGGHANAQDLKEYVGSLFFTDFLRFTMANVVPGSLKLWVHCFAAYLLTAIVVRELLIEYETFNSIRHRYLLSREPHLRTVLVTNIPRNLRSSRKITSYFQHVYPNGAVKNVLLCQNLIELERLVAERTQVLSRIENELLLLCRSEKKKLYEQYSNWCCGCCCPSSSTNNNSSNGSHHRPSFSALASNTTNVTGGGGTTVASTGSSSHNNKTTASTKRHLLSWQLCCDCWRGGVDGTQERLSNLYIQLEDYNTKIYNEQRRRRRVMKMLDRMESVEGMKDIDYVLSSPFVNPTSSSSNNYNNNNASPQHNNNNKRTTGSATNGTDSAVTATTAPLPAPIPEEGEEFHLSSPGALQSPQQEQPEQPSEYNMTEANPLADGLRSRSPTATTTSTLAAHATTVPNQETDDKNVEDPDQKLASTKGNAIAAGTSSAWPSSKKASLHRKNAPPFLKAKHAIRRYSRVNREVSFLGRPIRSPNSFGAGAGNHKATHKNKNGKLSGIAAAGGLDSLLPISEPMENHLNEVTDKAFVVMRTYTAATIAIQSMHSSKPGSMQVSTAPEPRDILWENIYVSKGAQRTRSMIGEFVVKMIVCFYIIPIATVALLVSESALVSSSPRLAQLDQASAIFSVAIAMVQPMFIVGLQQLLPPLFVVIGEAEGRTSFSEVQMQAFSRYFLFQVLNVFLVTTIAGTIFDTIAIIIEKPESAFEMLGNSLPRMSSFFITFVIMKAFLGLGMEMVRIVAIGQGIVKFMMFPNATLRMKRQVVLGLRPMDDPGWFPFHKVLAQDMLVVVVSVVFAVVAPLVLFPCALFCLLSRITWTHQHLYVYESVFESGGQFWPKIFRRFVFGLIIAQMTITGQFILKEARHEAYATMALMFMTYFFLRSTRARYDPTSSTLPLEVATVMDITLQQEEEARNLQRQQQQYGDEEYYRGGINHNSKRPGEDGFDPISPPRSGHHIIGVDDDDEDNEEPGRLIAGRHDPFRKAYVQPALRANPKARPEQPFPPAQLGREEAFLCNNSAGGDVDGGSLGADSGMHHDSAASVRVRSLNQQERRIIDRWWNDQLQRAGPQNFFMVLIGEECGTLTLSNTVPSNSSSNAGSSNIMLNETHSFV
ncbi:hypothetical protein ACA910_001418 [Epithemia clementina (nom. ined.)]